MILASRSAVFEMLFSSAPLAHKHLTPDSDAHHISVEVGVWSVTVPDDTSLRLVLEWCYFSSVPENALNETTCWNVRITAKRFDIGDLLEYVDRWVSDSIAK